MPKGTPMLTCASCKRVYLTWERRDPEGRYTCSQCRVEHPVPAAEDLRTGQLVRLRSGGWPTPTTEMIIVSVDGDNVAVHPLGLPEERFTRTVPIGEIIV